MNYSEFKGLVEKTMNGLVREQEFHTARVACNPGATIEEIKLEAGKLLGIGILTLRLDNAAKEYFKGEEI